MARTAFSTVIEADQPIVADRQMWWTRLTAYGTHAETGVVAPARDLVSRRRRDPFRLRPLLPGPESEPGTGRRARPLSAARRGAAREDLSGPGHQPADDLGEPRGVPRPGRAAVARQHRCLGRRRRGAGAAGHRRARHVSRRRADGHFKAGHESAGVTAPSTDWFLAEGATGTFFNLFVLLANPTDTPTTVEATYLLSDGLPPVVRQYAGRHRAGGRSDDVNLRRQPPSSSAIHLPGGDNAGARSRASRSWPNGRCGGRAASPTGMKRTTPRAPPPPASSGGWPKARVPGARERRNVRAGGEHLTSRRPGRGDAALRRWRAGGDTDVPGRRQQPRHGQCRRRVPRGPQPRFRRPGRKCRPRSRSTSSSNAPSTTTPTASSGPPATTPSAPVSADLRCVDKTFLEPLMA